MVLRGARQCVRLRSASQTHLLGPSESCGCGLLTELLLELGRLEAAAGRCRVVLVLHRRHKLLQIQIDSPDVEVLLPTDFRLRLWSLGQDLSNLDVVQLHCMTLLLLVAVQRIGRLCRIKELGLGKCELLPAHGIPKYHSLASTEEETRWL